MRIDGEEIEEVDECTSWRKNWQGRRKNRRSTEQVIKAKEYV